MSEAGRCAVCGAGLTSQAFFVVRMDVFADPSAPADLAESADAGVDQIAILLAQMANMSAEELQDGVHRRFEYRVCGKCQKLLLSNPLGLPRHRSSAPVN